LDGAVLTDGDEVRNLLGRYCERIDDGDFDGVGELFAHGRLATEDGSVLAEGAEAIAAFYAKGTRRHGPTPRTKHLVVDTVLEPSADGDAMVARSSYVVFQALEGELALQPIIAGRYVDSFQRRAERWTWIERRFAVDLVGDLSHHLAFDL
jgi:3-phenylpropionate/cinnamic acid dioxygenase small subunit